MEKIKSRGYKIACVIIGAALLLGGCSAKEVVTLPQLTQDSSVTEQTDAADSAGTEEASSEELLEEVSEVYYVYHTLEAHEQRVYLQVLHALEQMAGEMSVSTLDTDELDHAFQCVMADHPELFYVSGYGYTQHLRNDVVTELIFNGQYDVTAEEATQQSAQIEAAAESYLSMLNGTTEELISAVNGEMDEYTQIKTLYDALIAATEYDREAENNQDIRSVFISKRSVCSGYAKAMQYLLQHLGIQTARVLGNAGGEGHAWNLVRVDGDYYYLDVTWGDASYTNAERQTQETGTQPPINYDYFLVTTEELLRTHQPDDLFTLPECTAVQDNYFIREGCYLEDYDEDTLKLIFQDISLNNAGYATIKCSDKAVFEQVLSKLVDDQEIFNYLDLHDGSIAYTTNQSQLTMYFWR